MTDCIYEERGGAWVCVACGDVRKHPARRNCREPAAPGETPPRYAIVEELPAESRKLLGDRAADLFAALGIPKCSSCAARQAWLNAAHRWVLERWG